MRATKEERKGKLPVLAPPPNRHSKLLKCLCNCLTSAKTHMRSADRALTLSSLVSSKHVVYGRACPDDVFEKRDKMRNGPPQSSDIEVEGWTSDRLSERLKPGFLEGYGIAESKVCHKCMHTDKERG